MKYEFLPQKVIDLKKHCGYRIWEKPKPTGIYAIGADVAEGVGGDASCAVVINCTNGFHAATFWSNAIDVDNYAVELFKTGSWYNRANICIESNNHGHAVIALLGGAVGSLAYPNLYKRIEYDEYTAQKKKTIGFRTSNQTKPRIIENLKSALKSGTAHTFDKELIQELSSFIRDAKTGKMAAKGKAHDDRVMAFALAWEQARIIKENLQLSKEGSLPQQYYDPATGFPIAGPSSGVDYYGS